MEKQTKGIGIAIGLGIAGFLVWLTIHEPTALVASIMGGLVAGIINSIIWSLTPDATRERKKERHTQVIITALEKLVYVQAVLQADKTLRLMIRKDVNVFIDTDRNTRRIIGTILLSIQDPNDFFPLEELRSWDWAKAHLKDKYDEPWNAFYSAYNKIEEYNKHNSENSEKLYEMREGIKRTLGDFSDELCKLIQQIRDGAELKGKCTQGY